MTPRLPIAANLRPSADIARPTAIRFARFRSTSTFASATPMAKRPTFAAGSDVPALDAALAPLLSPSSSSPGGRWTLTADGGGIERSFRFKTFAKTWDFMTAVALQCKIKNHHPEWSNVYNTTYIRWTTHNPRGLSAKDVELATVCDRLARDFGEVQEEQSPAPATCDLRDLASSAAASAGDCCGPKNSKPVR